MDTGTNQQQVAPLAPPDALASHRPLVLVVDDSRLVRVSIKKVLKQEFDVLEAVDGEDGWRQLQENAQIQVVITDQGMPKLDGFGLIQRVRTHADARIQSVPIIMVTGAEQTDTAAREQALQLGATDFIVKPFDPTQLLARTRAQAKLDRTRRHLQSTESALAEQSVIDNLSKLHNKKYFLQRGEKELSIATRHGHDLALFCIEIDKFSQIEHTQGEKCATALVQWVAQTIFNRLRKEDTVARIDTSRFAVLAPMTGRLDAAVLCERLRNEFAAAKFTAEHQALMITVSIGLVNLGKDHADKLENLLAVAEQRALEAAANGGNRVLATTREGTSQAVKDERQELNLDSVVRVLRKGNVNLLVPHAKAMALLLLPVLEFCNKTLRWNLDAEIGKIRLKITADDENRGE